MKFKYVKPLSVLLLSLGMFFSTELAAQTNVTELFRGSEISQTNGILSKFSNFIHSEETSIDTPFYKNLQKLSQIGINPQDLIPPQYRSQTEYEYHDHPYTGMSIPLASVTDASGNTYITGTESNSNSPEGNFVTIKIDANGVLVWEKVLTGTTYAGELGMEITLDSFQNPIVSGIYWNGNDMDIKTLKLDPSNGDILWESVYDGGNEGLDVPAAITTDSNNNIIIAGVSYTGTNVAYVTLKYDLTGVLIWSTTDNNPVEDSWNEPFDVTTDPNNNIIVTGYGGNASYWAGYYTIKYDTFGQEVWKDLYIFQNGGDTNSIARDAEVAANGDVYVTGTFDTFQNRIGTIKYDSNGVEQWIDTYQSGTNFTDGFGVKAVAPNTIYVGGGHKGNFTTEGVVLISYQADGTQNWVEETTDLFQVNHVELKLDDNNLPVIAGKGNDPSSSDQRIRVYQYSELGAVLNQTSYFKAFSPTGSANEFIGLGIDSAENIYLTLGAFYTSDGGVFEFSKHPITSGDNNPDWTETYGDQDNSGTNMLFATHDVNNNTYITGRYGSIESNEFIQNHILTKYNENGEVAWEKEYSPSNGNGSEGIRSMIDNSGNIIVYLVPGTFGTDPARIKKYSPDGTLLWEFEKLYYSPSLYTLFTDNEDNVILAGSSKEDEFDPFPTFTTTKISSSGTELWTNFETSSDPNDNIFELNAGGITSQGEIVLIGTLGEGSFFSQTVDQAILRYNSNGTFQSLDVVNIPQYNSAGSDMLIDENDNILINGVKQHSTTFEEELILTKLNASGAQEWASSYGETGRKVRSYTVEALSNGSFVVSGFSNDLATNKVILVNFDSNGDQSWATETEINRFYRDMHVDDEDTIYLLNQAYSSTYPYRIGYALNPLTIASLFKVDATGTGVEELMGSPELSMYNPSTLMPLSNGTLLIGGTISHELNYFSGFYFFNSEHTVLGIEDNDSTPGAGNRLEQNYPNPVIQTTTIPFYLINGGDMTLTIYDNSGRSVFQKKYENFAPGASEIKLDLSFLRSGIYFYQLKTRTFKKARKLIKS